MNLRPKRIYTFMIQSFVPLFAMTFFICLFIVLMQFLWRYIDDLVGKGLSVDVIMELFFYAALTMVPMALPLAILLASLMTFGNLGEKFELTAIKAAGISLLKVMKPLTALMILIAIGAFFFQNDVLPIAQTKMWTLLYSMRQKSPEVEIPEGVFYDQLPGLNIYVKSKDKETGRLYDMMIYDMSRGFDNARVLMADSGKLSVTEDGTHLFLTLDHGTQSENLREAEAGNNAGNMPYRRETFDSKQILVAFDNNFTRMDESGMRNQYVGKNITELKATIDSVTVRVDSMGRVYGRSIVEQPYVGVDHFKSAYVDGKLTQIVNPEVKVAHPMNFDSIVNAKNGQNARTYYTHALGKTRRVKQDYEYKALAMEDDVKTIRRHGIEMHKKFTLSFACIIFFFIGAPLGAIIRKGGLGTPLVISVLLFIVYYIIDNTGYKMARDGRMDVWEGMWLSSFILLPLGIFFTYKAMNDSAVFNKDAYVNFFVKLLGLRQVRHVAYKDIAMDDVVPSVALERLNDFKARTEQMLSVVRRRQHYLDFCTKGLLYGRIKPYATDMNELIEYLANSRDKLVVNKLSDFPVIIDRLLLHPITNRKIGIVVAILFPIGFLLYIIGGQLRRSLASELRATLRVTDQLIEIYQGEVSTGIAPESPTPASDDVEANSTSEN